MALDRAAIVAADDLDTVEVEVKEWGGSVRIRQLPTKQMLDFMEEMSNTNGAADPEEPDYEYLYGVLYLTLVDDNGDLVFESLEQAKKVLEGKSLKVITRLANRATNHVVVTNTDVNKGKADSNRVLSSNSPTA